jgi:hypothetical protein
MYVALSTFKSLRGTIFHQGQEISNLRYMLLTQHDKGRFAKKNISKGTTVKEEKREMPIPRSYPRSTSKPSNNHYGYGPEPGYSSSHTPVIYIDDSPSPPSHSSHSFGDFGGGDTGGAGSSGGWDSGSSSSDSSSCDSGGGDCGGGCDGGGGGGD